MPFKFSVGCCCGSDCDGCCTDSLSGDLVADMGDMGWTNNVCTDCADVGGEYNLAKDPGLCSWFYLADTECIERVCAGNNQIRISASLTNAGGTCTLALTFLYGGFSANELCGNSFVQADYSLTFAAGTTCVGEHELTLVSSSSVGTPAACNDVTWPATITVTLA